MKLILSFLLLAAVITSVSAEVSVEVFYKENTGDETWVRPVIKIDNTGTQSLNLNETSVKYYFFEVTGDGQRIDPDHFISDVWNFSKGSITNVTISFIPFEPPYTSAPKKANLVCLISFNGSIILDPGQTAEVQFGFHKSDWSVFIESEHYSYTGATAFALNPRIVVTGPSGIINGIEPGSANGNPDFRLPMNWIGVYDAPPLNVQVGDVYKNSNGKVLVYSDSKWTELGGDAFWTKITGGITYTGGKIVANDIEATNVAAKTMVTTPRWKMKLPDYVFESGYKLEKLPEIEEYVKKYKHLKDIPCAAELEKDGIELSHFNMLLLKKIEELTLHVIELNKKVSKYEQKEKISVEQNN